MRYAAKGTVERIPLTTRSDRYYDFEISPLSRERCTVSVVRKPVEKDLVHTPEEYDSHHVRIIGRQRNPAVLRVMPVK